MAVLAQLSAHVVQHVEQEVVAGGMDGVDGLPRARLHHQRKAGGPGQEFIDRRGHQRAGGPGRPADLPGIAHVDHHPVADQVEIRVLRNVQLDQLALLEEVLGPLVETGPVEDPDVAAATGIVAGHERPDVVGGDFHDLLRGGERSAAPPELDHPRVSRGRHAPGAEIGADQNRVLVHPAQGGFGLRNPEAVRHELLGDEIELPGLGGVGAAPGERHQTALVGRLETIGPAE